jgi:predicted HNH restriction endonuclease
MGGSKTKDYIENLIALCRNCHDMAHDEVLTKGDLTFLHKRKMGGATTGAMGKKLR